MVTSSDFLAAETAKITGSSLVLFQAGYNASAILNPTFDDAFTVIQRAAGNPSLIFLPFNIHAN
jgi:hypothetical protein